MDTKGECGFPLHGGYIVGGEKAIRGELPFIALLGYAILSLTLLCHSVIRVYVNHPRFEQHVHILLNSLTGYWKPSRERIEFKCAGSLINRRYVLTAAHCHVKGKLEISTIVLGEYNVSMDPDCAGCR